MKINIEKIKEGDRRELSKAITLSEDSRPEAKKETEELFKKIPVNNNTLRIAITGGPGSGKSSLIEKLGIFALQYSKKIAVLAIDPSSPINGGSIMGDKLRMEKLAANPNAYIRPSPSKGHLGGVTSTTREAILLCELAGFNFIIIETVGVGQSEIEAKMLADILIYIAGPNTGDEIQGIKRGILEVSDLIVVNKHDGSSALQAEITKQQLENSLMIKGKNDIPVILTSTLKNTGIDTLYEAINKRFNMLDIASKRKNQIDEWIINLGITYLLDKIKNSKSLQEQLRNLEQEIWNNKKTSFNAAKDFIIKLKEEI